MTDAKDIELTKGMLKLLRQSSTEEGVAWSPVEDTAAARSLLYFSLIYISRSGNTARITEKGMQVLLHYENSEKTRRSDRIHSWLIAIFSTIGGAFLSKPVWAILEWIADLIQKLL